MNIQFCAIIDYKNCLGLGSSSGFDFPRDIIHSLKQDSSLELGTIMGNLSGDKNIKHDKGAIGYYSNIRITRIQITKQAIEMALISHLNKEKYFN